MFKLRFPESDIARWANLYSYPRAETELLEQRPSVAISGKLTKKLLEQVAQWKSPRSAGRVSGNSEAFVEEITSFAFAGKEERTRIEALTLLDGVQWPTASVILHLFHREPYPIIDFRALWSLGAKVPEQYSFAFWWDYVKECRLIRNRTGTDMRSLDRALWQYSKQNQSKRVARESAAEPGAVADRRNR